MTDNTTATPIADQMAAITEHAERLLAASTERDDAERAQRDAAHRDRLHARAATKVEQLFPDHPLVLAWTLEIDRAGSDDGDAYSSTFTLHPGGTRQFRFVYRNHWQGAHHALALQEKCRGAAIVHAGENERPCPAWFEVGIVTGYVGFAQLVTVMPQAHEPWECQIAVAVADGMDYETAEERFAPAHRRIITEVSEPKVRRIIIGSAEDRLLTALRDLSLNHVHGGFEA